MTQFFFSVDVETTSTNPFTGELLTLAVVPIRSDTWEILEGDHWALEYDRSNCDPDTVQWWKEQSPEAYTAAWEGERMDPIDVAEEVSDYVLSFTDVLHDRIFAANPASFDWAWIEKLFASSGVSNPFSHRTLCMRSVRYGHEGGVWGTSRYKNEHVEYAEIPHHAYYDALAQAKDLVSLIGMNNRVNETVFL